jgi:hypothetical protein
LPHFDDHVFVSLRRRRLLVGDAETAFHESIEKIGFGEVIKVKPQTASSKNQ